jgi:glycosyltransferase involved in cell wall biosynthesis
MANKKLIIFPGNFLPHSGGLETHVDEFVKYLSREKFDITIFAPNSGGKNKETIHKKVKVFRYPSIEIINNYTFPKFWNSEYKKLKESIGKDYDFVMTRTRFFPNSFLGAKFAKKHKIPLIHVEHGSSHVKVSNPLVTFIARIWDETITKYIVKNSKTVVSISSAVHNFMKKYTKNDVIIPRGVDYEPYEKIKPHPITKNYTNKIKVCTAARLYSWKGIENAIKAVKDLDLIYFIAGDGVERKKLESIAGNNVIFLGNISHSEAVSLFKGCDIYLHSSYPGGGLNSALMQAMRSGCMPVASPNEGAVDIVNKKTGILCKDNSANSLRKGLQKAIKSNIKSYGIASREFIKKEYSWKKSIEKYKKLF